MCRYKCVNEAIYILTGAMWWGYEWMIVFGI